MKATRVHRNKPIFYTLIGVIILIFSLALFSFLLEQYNLRKPVKLGLTYTPRYAKELGLEPKLTFEKIVTELHPKTLRLTAYWDEIEPSEGNFDFTDLNWYINKAYSKNIPVVLTVGYKVPRWPECFAPSWIDKKNIPLRQVSQLKMVEKVVREYSSNPAVSAFQIENEPFLNFGICPPPDREFFKKEVALVRSLTQKPIVITDSGELRTWKTPMQLSDVFGTTIYRTVSNPYLGETQYPFQPSVYTLKYLLIKTIFAPNNKEAVIAELQTESWFDKPLLEVPVEKQILQYRARNIKLNVEYARKTGFEEIWLWGVEWWYYLESNGRPEYVKTAKEIFNE